MMSCHYGTRGHHFFLDYRARASSDLTLSLYIMRMLRERDAGCSNVSINNALGLKMMNLSATDNPLLNLVGYFKV